MVGIAVISHGQLCEGIMNSVEMVAGNAEQLGILSLKPGMSPDIYREDPKKMIETLDTGDGVLVLADLLGGTPFNSSAMLSENMKIQIVTGMNMPMLVSLVLERAEEDTLDDLAQRAVEEGKNGINALKR